MMLSVTLCSAPEITPDGLWRPYGMLRIESGSVSCKASSLPLKKNCYQLKTFPNFLRMLFFL